ncbi:MAG: S8 family serine peptidase [Chloroflexota bacterium]|nr:S8 family serine peptidase [Chloroflexota bacterium]
MSTRYSVTSEALPVNEVARLCLAAGGSNLVLARYSAIVFVDLTDEQAARLATTLHVSSVREVRADEVRSPPEPASAPQGFSAQSLAVATQFEQVRNTFSPPLTGAGARVAVIDSGINPHESIGDRVIFEKDYTGSGSARDEFNHGTGVASMIASIAPGAKMLNCRVLGPTGVASVEPVVMAIEDMIDLVRNNDPRYPTMINLSLGTPDTGDPNDPLRLACRAAVRLGRPEEVPGPHQLIIIVAAGNDGPAPGTVTSPAVDGEVLAVGALKTSELAISDFSSRGPTQEALVKPDAVFYGQDIVLASADGPTNYKVRTGTSFAAPAIVAVIALSVEMGWRMMGNPVPVPGVQGTITPQPTMTVADLFDLASRVCVKPAGVPAGKDNAYGYGMPFGTLVQSAFKAAAFSLTDLVSPVITLAMLGMMARAFTPRR